MNFVYRDFKKIHEEYLKTGDASGGKLRWDLALIDRHYDDKRLNYSINLALNKIDN